MKNERTSARVASIAARMIGKQAKHKMKKSSRVFIESGEGLNKKRIDVGSWGDILAMSGSCTTQAADRPKAKKKAKR